MSKLLDLRDSGIDKVKVIEHIIFKPRSFKIEMIKMLSVIAIVSVLGWGISNADNLNPFVENGIETATENFSALGIVSEITQTNIIISEARGSDVSGKNTYNLNITNLEKVETSGHDPLIITDIKIGDKIIAQGLTNGNIFFIKRIVSFSTSASSILPVVATTTLDVATSTTETASTTTDTTASSTEVSETPISNESSTTTPEVITETSTTTEISTTTTETATTTEEATTTSSIVETVTGVVQDVIETVTNAVEAVVETVTGSNPEEPLVPSVPEPTPEPTVEPEPII